jgi:hypothetical protein
MKSICFVALLALAPAFAQVVKPTPGALAPVGSTPPPAVVSTAAPAPASSAVGTIPRTASNVAPSAFRRIESDFDSNLKLADQKNPLNVLGLTRGLYLPGFGVVFTTEVELAMNNFNPMFNQHVAAEAKTSLHDNKVRHVELLRQQMGAMVTNIAKNLTFLGPTDQVVVAVRLYYASWEDKTGLPDQIIMRADKHGAATGDIKVDIQ